MARPGGKAARRRARQRPPRRPVIAQPGLTRQPSRTEPPAEAGTDAAPAAAPAAAPRPALPPPTTSALRATSGLGERARAEYHYVGRDLRNIGVLMAVMAALLAVATVALPAIGLVGP